MPYSLIELWLAWLSAHLLGDFVFQTDRIAARKSDPNVLANHAAVHGVLAFAFTAYSGAAFGAALLLALSHAAIDWIKVRSGGSRIPGFALDQLAHVAVITGLALWLAPSLSPLMWGTIFGPSWIRVLILGSGFILCVKVTGHLIGLAVQPYLAEIRRESGAAPAIGLDSPTRGLTHAGRVIGQWERALIFLFILVGQPAGIGFLIAAKSIFRFGELKDPGNRREAEYITIGTLMSFGTAMAIAYATVWCARSLGQHLTR